MHVHFSMCDESKNIQYSADTGLPCPRIWRLTLAGVRSEKTMPELWMYLSPLIKSMPNSHTMFSDKHSSWEITVLNVPPTRIYSS